MSGVRSDCKFCSSFQADNLSSIFVLFYHNFTKSLGYHLLCCACKFCSSVQGDVLPSIFFRFHFLLHSTITCLYQTLAFLQILGSVYPHLHQPTPLNLQVTFIFTSHVSSLVFQYSHSPYPQFLSILYLSLTFIVNIPISIPSLLPSHTSHNHTLLQFYQHLNFVIHHIIIISFINTLY